MSRKYPLKVENNPISGTNPLSLGRDVRGLGPGIPNEMDLYLKEKGKPGRLIGLDDKVDLTEPGA